MAAVKLVPHRELWSLEQPRSYLRAAGPVLSVLHMPEAGKLGKMRAKYLSGSWRPLSFG